MRKLWTMLLSLAAILLVACALEAPAQAAEIVDSGTTDGGRVTWTLDSDGVLTFSGDGQIPADNPWEWEDSSNDARNYPAIGVRHIVVEDGIIDIGSDAFTGFEELETVTIGKGVTWLSASFSDSKKLREVYLSEGLQTIGGFVFDGCTGLEQVHMPDSLRDIGERAFRDCTSLGHIVIPAQVREIGAYAFMESQILSITFLGEEPRFGDYCFYRVYTTAYYPHGCGYSRWQCVGGELEWVDIHVFGEYQSNQDATCTADGTKTAKCLYCDYTDTVMDVGSKLPHTYEVGIDGGRGEAWHICTVCTACEPVEVIGAGSAGNGVQWMLEPDGVLTILGDGSLSFYTESTLDQRPWHPYREQIQEIRLEIGGNQVNNYCFAGCVNLKKVTIPEGIVRIANGAFADCGLTELVFPSTLTNISQYAFSGCTALEEVTFTTGVTYLGEYAFADCTGLRKLTFMGSKPTLSDMCLGNVSATLDYICEDGSWAAAWEEPHGGDIVWNPTHHFEGYTYNQDATCTSDGTQTGVCAKCGAEDTIDATGTALGHDYRLQIREVCNTCDRCGHTEPLEALGNGRCGADIWWIVDRNGKLTIAGIGEMYDYTEREKAPWSPILSSIKTIEISEGVTAIGDMAFSGCAMKEIRIPEGVTRIGEDAFANCTRLATVFMPKSISYLNFGAFYNCYNLQALHISSLRDWLRVEIDGYSAAPFNRSAGDIYCNGSPLTQIIQTGMSIPDYAFLGCRNLEYVYCSGDSVGSGAFWKCDGIEKIYFDGVQSIGSAAFIGCKGLKEVKLDEVECIGANAFSDCVSLTTLYLPETLTNMDSGAFNRCTNLRSVNLPDNLEVISSGCFEDCTSLQKIYIPKSVNRIEESAFARCSGLRQVWFYGSLPELGVNCFSQLETEIYYSCLDSSWTEEARQAYGGKDVRWYANHSYNGTTCSLCNKQAPLWVELEFEGGDYGYSNNYLTIYGDGQLLQEIKMTVPNKMRWEIPYNPCVSYRFCWSGTSGSVVSIGHGSHYYLQYEDPAYLWWPVLELPAASAHSFERGVCTMCGTESADYLPMLNLKYPTLSFEDEIFYNVYFEAGNTKNVVEMGLITFNERLEDGTVVEAVDVIASYEEAKGQYMVRSNGISAKKLGDTLYFKVYAKLSDGSYVYSEIAGYHAVAYASTILNGSYGQEAKALVVAMLNYGAAAQLQFGYRTDCLMNAHLTPEQRALVRDYDASMLDAVIPADINKVGEFTSNNGYLEIRPSVSFEGAFAINFYFTPTQNTSLCGMMYYWDADTYARVDELTSKNATGKMWMNYDGTAWIGEVRGLAAKDIDKTIYIAGIYIDDAGTYSSGVISYSLGRYCENVANQGIALGEATAVYGHYAKAYFA